MILKKKKVTKKIIEASFTVNSLLPNSTTDCYYDVMAWKYGCEQKSDISFDNHSSRQERSDCLMTCCCSWSSTSSSPSPVADAAAPFPCSGPPPAAATDVGGPGPPSSSHLSSGADWAVFILPPPPPPLRNESDKSWPPKLGRRPKRASSSPRTSPSALRMPTISAPPAIDGAVKQTVLHSGSSFASDNGFNGRERSRPVKLLLRCRHCDCCCCCWICCWWCWYPGPTKCCCWFRWANICRTFTSSVRHIILIWTSVSGQSD